MIIGFGLVHGVEVYADWISGKKVFDRPFDDQGEFVTNLPDNVMTFRAEGSHLLWIGTWGNGLYAYDRDRDRLIEHRYDVNQTRGLSSNQVTSVHIDASNILWVGTWDRLNKSTSRTEFVQIEGGTGNPNSLSHPPDQCGVCIPRDTGTRVGWYPGRWAE